MVAEVAGVGMLYGAVEASSCWMCGSLEVRGEVREERVVGFGGGVDLVELELVGELGFYGDCYCGTAWVYRVLQNFFLLYSIHPLLYTREWE